MPSITGPYEAPFDPSERPPIWLVPLGQVREATLVALCKGCQHQRRWPVAELVERYGRRRFLRDLWVRWRCSRCRSADCPPYAIDR